MGIQAQSVLTAAAMMIKALLLVALAAVVSAQQIGIRNVIRKEVEPGSRELDFNHQGRLVVRQGPAKVSYEVDRVPYVIPSRAAHTPRQQVISSNSGYSEGPPASWTFYEDSLAD